MSVVVTRLIKLAGSLVVRSIDLSKGFILRCIGKKRTGTCVVLYYHSVTQEQRDLFARQMEWLGKHCKPISLDELADPDGRTDRAAVTFDDGIESAILNALPELVPRRIPITVFVPSGCLGQCPSWLRTEGQPKKDENVLDAQYLRELNGHPQVSIGSHCVSHSDLLCLDHNQARAEIFGSKLQLQEILGEEIRFLSFPFGSFDERHVQFAYEAGYKCVFSISPELLVATNSEKYIIGRVRVDPTDWPLEFRLKAVGAYRWLPRSYSLKQRLRRIWHKDFDTGNID